MKHKTVSTAPPIMNVSKLNKYAPAVVQSCSVSAVLLALGSNHQAEYYLPRVRDTLSLLGNVQLSTAFRNPDFTATQEYPKPDYTNQCIYLLLASDMRLEQLQSRFKAFESECHRQRSTKLDTIKQVTMDIDILLVKLSGKENSLSNKKSDKWKSSWIVIADRYPFKEHENIGIAELLAKNNFNA